MFSDHPPRATDSASLYTPRGVFLTFDSPPWPLHRFTVTTTLARVVSSQTRQWAPAHEYPLQRSVSSSLREHCCSLGSPSWFLTTSAIYATRAARACCIPHPVLRFVVFLLPKQLPTTLRTPRRITCLQRYPVTESKTSLRLFTLGPCPLVVSHPFQTSHPPARRLISLTAKPIRCGPRTTAWAAEVHAFAEARRPRPPLHLTEVKCIPCRLPGRRADSPEYRFPG